LRGGRTIHKIQNKRKLTFIGLVVVLLASFVSIGVSAVTISPDTHFIVGNEDYTVHQTMNFNSITIASSYIIFNTTGFYVTSGNDIDITLVYISNDFSGASNGDKVLEFYASTTSGNVWFNLSGFVAGRIYTVNRSSSTIANPTANGSGYISFSNNVWSEHLFEIFQQGMGAGDVISPEISGVSRTSSDPLDTEQVYGWVNITCDVTDNIAVDEVSFNITNPDGSYNNVSMNAGAGDSYYYNSNTAFSTYENYSYLIWADDTSDNQDISSGYTFSMPPNWDLNNDGECNVFDQVLISNHYGETGTNGWIREDVDNDGQIDVLDLVFVSNHYGESWWG